MLNLSFNSKQLLVQCVTATAIGIVMSGSVHAVGSGYSKQSQAIDTETRLYVSRDCLITDNAATQAGQKGLFAAILGVIVPLVIDSTIDLVVDELKKIRKEESTGKLYAPLYVYDPASGASAPDWDPNLNCFTAITGKFSPGPHNSTVKASSWNFSSPAPSGQASNTPNESNPAVIQRLRDNRILLADDMYESIFETRIVFEEDETAFRLESQYLHVASLQEGLSRSAGQVYTWQINGPGTSPNKEVYALASIDLGTVKPGTEITKAKFLDPKTKGQKTGLIAKVGMTKASLAAFKKQPKAIGYTPAFIQMTNTQTKKPGKAAELVAALLKGAKTNISTAVTEAIVPADQDALDASILDARIAVATALAAKAAGPTQEAKDLADLQLEKACNALEELGETSNSCP